MPKSPRVQTSKKLDKEHQKYKTLGSALALTALVAGAVACGGGDTTPEAKCPPSVAAPAGEGRATGPAVPTPQPGPPTVAEATSFTDAVDAELKRLWVRASRAGWVNQTFITEDTDQLSAAAEEATMEYLSRTIPAAKRFDGMKLPDEVARKLHLLKIASVLPAPSDAAERRELAETAVAMQSMYGRGKYCPKAAAGKDAKGAGAGKASVLKPKDASGCFTLQDLSNILSTSRKYDELLEAWTGWHAIATPIKDKFRRYVELGNKGAREIGFKDLGALWRSGYDMPPEAFEAETDRLWTQVKPLYDELHCYVRSRLRNHYGKDRAVKEKMAGNAPIPAHLLGNMWAQEWNNIYPLVEPFPGEASLDVTKTLKDKKMGAVEMVKLGERFFTSLGLEKLPETFWERSLFKKPEGREVVCHASAWDVTYAGDIRIKMCIEPTEEDLTTIHHELGHNYYYVYYHKLPVLFQQGANDGFHEGIGDTLVLSVTPGYLKDIGLLDRVSNNPKAETNFLLKQALDKVAFLPFGKLIDQWRWDVFNGKTQPAEYNKAWWDLRVKYQGVAPPVGRTEAEFDAGAKYHVPANTPYVRYFLARIYQFQFHKALCEQAGHKGPLHTCSIHGSKEAGSKLRAMLAMGASRPWPEAMRAITGQPSADAGPLLEYFEPLRKWLKEQTKGETCGW
ncbi:MAG TPA: M2 family metallopeptidase [Polyangiaceae bacterium]|nr:M2 family metallopeptidase [Polyangiaceae bacterium]